MKMIPPASVAGFVLAGGQSSRMGADKALALFAGRPLIQIALESFTGVGINARIVSARSLLNGYAEQIHDTYHEAGPLGGVHGALAASEAEWNLFLPVDLPLMPASLISCLLRRAFVTGAVVTAACLNGILQPFPVVLHRSVLGAVAQRLQEGSTACHRAWRAIPTEIGSCLDAADIESVVQCGQCADPDHLPPTLWFRSANTPGELALLNRIHAKVHPSRTALLK